jgi:hypothetical protein
MGPDVTQRTWRRVRVCPTRYDVRAKSVFVVTRLGLWALGFGVPGSRRGLDSRGWGTTWAWTY